MDQKLGWLEVTHNWDGGRIGIVSYKSNISDLLYNSGRSLGWVIDLLWVGIEFIGLGLIIGIGIGLWRSGSIMDRDQFWVKMDSEGSWVVMDSEGSGLDGLVHSTIRLGSLLYIPLDFPVA